MAGLPEMGFQAAFGAEYDKLLRYETHPRPWRHFPSARADGFLSIKHQETKIMQTVYQADNVFAKILRGEIPNHTVYEDGRVLAFMDVMPQAEGHVLIVPKTEAVELSDLPDEYAAAVFAAAKKIMAAQRKVFRRQGIVQMQLNHAEAGQSVFHYHMHLIPGHIRDLGAHESVAADHGALADAAARLREALADGA